MHKMLAEKSALTHTHTPVKLSSLLSLAHIISSAWMDLHRKYTENINRTITKSINLLNIISNKHYNLRCSQITNMSHCYHRPFTVIHCSCYV